MLLLFPSHSYRLEAFVEAAARIGVELVLATDLASAVRKMSPHVIEVAFGDERVAATTIVGTAQRLRPIHGVLATNEATAVAGALVARELGLPFASPDGARAARDKRAMRARLAEANVPSARHMVVRPDERAEDVAARARFPCVVKPPMLSGSQGVIRANDREELARAMHRTRAILAAHPTDLRDVDGFFDLVVEDYLPGKEVAVEALMTNGTLEPIAIFDKPDDLSGPFFEETIYVTPSRLSPAAQASILEVTESAARALGLVHGPIHAELRVDDDRASILEVAARSIGGLCSRVFSFAAGPLEDVLLAHAAGLSRPRRTNAHAAAGVMMMPIPRSGVLRSVDGLDDARAVDGIESVSLSLEIGASIRALPEGAAYLGFIFARGDSAAFVERALREAFARIRFSWSPLLT